MEELLHLLWHGFLDSAKMLPLLAAVYLLIEFLEYKKFTSFENSKLLKGNLSPIFGALFGCVPQCGFSVISTDLYAEKKISVGALVAVYVATSDEALPMMLSSPSSIPALLLLIGVKIVIGVSVGYLAMFLLPRLFRRNAIVSTRIQFKSAPVPTVQNPNKPSAGCCNHEIKTKTFSWLHPLLHSLKIFGFVLAINLVMELLVHFVGEENIAAFLTSAFPFQPLFACLVGMIPNCASSVVLTELFMSGQLTFGSIVAGLSMNAGLGILVLFKKNRPIKENWFIVGLIALTSIGFGYLLHVLLPL